MPFGEPKRGDIVSMPSSLRDFPHRKPCRTNKVQGDFYMESKPDTIKISATQREEIFASHANLYVTVKGSSVVSGNEAMKKAREVSQLVEALTRPALSGGEGSGLSPEAVQLLGVHIETASGALLKSSSATYRLRIRVERLDQLAELLDIIASQKNAT